MKWLLMILVVLSLNTFAAGGDTESTDCEGNVVDSNTRDNPKTDEVAKPTASAADEVNDQ